MEQRERFIRDERLALYTMVELCDRYGVSRKTGYKWLARFDAGGRAGLQDQSRAPHQCPHRIADNVAQLICMARRQHPSWGPEKLLQWLAPRHPGVELPAISTAGDLLARRGLVKKRRRRRTYQHPGVVPATTTQPNDLWTAFTKLVPCDEPLRWLRWALSSRYREGIRRTARGRRSTIMSTPRGSLEPPR